MASGGGGAKDLALSFRFVFFMDSYILTYVAQLLLMQHRCQSELMLYTCRYGDSPLPVAS
jgi:hypothetical protein